MRYFLVFLVACGAAQRPLPTTGAISGIARDHDTGDPVAKAEIRVRAQGQMTPLLTTTRGDGGYKIDHLAPGRYTLSALFAGQPIEVGNIEVHTGDATIVDLTFTLGRTEPLTVDYGNPKEGEIDRYRPRSLSPQMALIEGTVNDAGSHERVAGAVVTATGAGDVTIQTVSDDQGRYRFDPVHPGTYSVSAYYSIGGRGQIEVRRGDIAVAGGEAAIVPLWIELAKQ